MYCPISFRYVVDGTRPSFVPFRSVNYTVPLTYELLIYFVAQLLILCGISVVLFVYVCV